MTKRRAEGSVGLRFGLYWHSVEGSVGVDGGVNATPRQAGEGVVDVANRMQITHGAFVEGTIVDTPANFPTRF